MDSIYWGNYASCLADIKTESSYSILKQFLNKEIQNLDSYTSTLYILRDSLQLTKKLFPDLLYGIDSSRTINYSLFTLITTMLDSSIIDYSDLIPFENNIYAIARNGIKDKSDKKDLFSTYYADSPLALLNRSPNKERFIQLCELLLKSRNVWCNYSGALMLQKNKRDNYKEMFTKIAKMPYLRAILFNELLKTNSIVDFPQKYNNIIDLSEADIYYTALEYDEIYFKKISFLKEVKTKYKDKDASFFLYKIDYDKSAESPPSLYSSGPYYFDEKIEEIGGKSNYVGEYYKGSEELTFLANLQADILAEEMSK